MMSKPRLARIGGSVRRIVCSAYEQDSFAIDLLNHFSVPNIRVDLACPNRLLAAATFGATENKGNQLSWQRFRRPYLR